MTVDPGTSPGVHPSSATIIDWARTSVESLAQTLTLDGGATLQRLTNAATASSGLPGVWVEEQLRKVLARFAPDALDASLRAALGTGAIAPDHGITRLLHVPAGNVPGLGIESLLWGMLLGCEQVLMSSSRDSASSMFIELAVDFDPRWNGRLEQAHRDRWPQADAAIVSGDDAVIDLVRSRLSSSQRVAGFGSRTSVALIHATAFDEPTAALLADDIGRFGQRGCMSPGRVIWIGNPTEAMEATTLLESSLQQYLETAGYTATATSVRAAADRTMLAAAAPSARQLILVQDVVVEVRRVGSSTDLCSSNLTDGTTISTAVVHSTDAAVHEALVGTAAQAGALRMCTPGTAHHPPPEWPHEGVGYLGPLLAPDAHLLIDAPPQK